MEIYVHNLRGIEDKKITVNHSSVLFGENGVGKTTLLMTPYWVLTGKGLSIKKGEIRGSAYFSFDNIKIGREMQGRKTNVTFNDVPTTLVALKKELSARGYSYELMVSLFNPSTEISSSAILRAIKGVYSARETEEALKIENDNFVFPLIDYINEKAIDIFDVPAMQKAAKDFTAKKREAGKALKELLPFLEETDLANYTSFINSVAKELDEHKEKRKTLRNEIDALNLRLGKQNALLQNLKRYQKELESIVFVDVPDLPESVADSVNSLEISVKKIEDELTEINKKRATLEAQITSLETTLTTTEKSVLDFENLSHCPICTEVTCDKKDVVPFLKQKIKEIEKQINSTRKQLDEVIASFDAKTKELNTLRKTLLNLKEKIKNNISAKKQNETAQKSKELYERNIEQILAETEDTTEISQTIKRKNEELTKVEADIAELSSQIQTLEALRKKQEQQKKLKKRIKELENERDACDFLSKRFTALPSETIESKLNILNQNISNVLKKVKATFSVNFEIDKDNLSIMVQTQKGNIPLNELSEGEQVCVYFAVKHMLSDLTGIDVILLDNGNHLDKKSMKLLLDMSENSNKLIIVAVPFSPTKTKLNTVKL